MRRIIAVAVTGVLLAGTGIGAAQAEPGGCLKYGAVGAVGGHLAHHGVMGAAAGCAAGMYKRHEYRKTQRAAALNNASGGTGNTATTTQ